MKHVKLWLALILALFAINVDLRAQENNSETPQTLCVGSVKFYRVDPSENAGGGTTNSTYAWSVITGPFAGTITTNQGPVVAWTAPAGSTNRIQIDWGASPAGPYQVQVIETSGDGCSGDPIILDVILTPLTLPNFNSIAPICQNAAAPALPPSSLNGITGTWSPAVINTSTVGTSAYTFTPNPGQCADVATLNVTITPLPTVLISGTDAICPGGSTNLTASGATSYTWSPALGLSATTGANVTASPATTTTYTVTGTDGSGCTATDDIVITVNPLPTITASANVAICDGESTVLQGFGGATYTWSPGTDLSATSGQSVTASPTSTITYTVTGTDANGCQNTASVEVTVNPNPTISITGSPTCSVDLLTYSLAVSVSAGDVTSTAGTVTNTSGNNWSITGVPAGTNITLTVTSGTCDEALAVLAPDCSCPTIANAISLGDEDFCIGSAIPTLGVQAVSGIAFDWYDAASGGTALATNTNTYTPTAAGVYYVQARDIATGCLSTTRTQITLTQNALPTIVATDDFAICEGDVATLTASGAVNYAWVGTGLVSNSGSTVTANLNTGVFTFTVTGTDGNGCTDTENVQVTVNPVPSITIVNAPTCSVDLLTWSVDVSVTAGTLTSSAGTITNTGGNNYTISGIGAGTNITLTVTALGCASDLAINAPVCNCPTVDAPIGTDASYCFGTTPIPALTATVLGGQTLNWYDAASGGTILGTGSPFVPSGPGTYYAEAVDNATGCVSSTRDAVTLTENALPNVTASLDVAICAGENTELTASGASTYSWNNAGSLSSSSGTPVTATPTSTTTYTVTGTDANGCQNTDSVIVTVNPLPTTSPIFHD